MNNVIFSHAAYDLKTVTPKERWKRTQSAIRYQRRYGKPKRIFKSEIGTYEGIRIIQS